MSFLLDAPSSSEICFDVYAFTIPLRSTGTSFSHVAGTTFSIAPAIEIFPLNAMTLGGDISVTPFALDCTSA